MAHRVNTKRKQTDRQRHTGEWRRNTNSSAQKCEKKLLTLSFTLNWDYQRAFSTTKYNGSQRKCPGNVQGKYPDLRPYTYLWSRRWSLRRKALAHVVQTNGLSSVCVRTWILRLYDFVNWRSQKPQMYCVELFLRRTRPLYLPDTHILCTACITIARLFVYPKQKINSDNNSKMAKTDIVCTPR